MTMGSTNAMLAQLIQDAVLKLCTQNVVFNRSLEIDGIICVSPGDEAKEIVVKMHRTIMKPMISQETPETTTNWSTENEQSSAYYPSNEAIESFPETLPQRPLHSTPTQRKRQMNNRDNVHRSATTTQPASPYVYNSRIEINPPVPTATQVTPGGVVVTTEGLTIKEEPPSSPKRIKRSLSEDMQQDTPGHSTEKQPKLDQIPGANDNQNMDNINIKQEKEEPITIELGDDDDEEEDGGGGYDEDSTAGASWMGDDTLDTSANNQADQNTVEQGMPHTKRNRAERKHTKGRQMIESYGDDDAEYHCKICGDVFRRENKLNIHLIKMHPGQKPYVCKHCSKCFNRKYEMKVHIKLHTKIGLLRCSVCNKTFCEKKGLTRHMRIHTGERSFKCEQCPKTFIEKGHLTKHMVTHRPDRKLQCAKAERKFQCAECSKRFKLLHHLKSHMLVHTGEKLYKCELCPKAFAQLGNYNSHVKTHSDIRPFQCEYCSKEFRTQRDMIVHIRIHTGEKPHKCEVCSKVFASRGSLGSHKIIHVEEKNYMCDYCSEKFVGIKHLNRHIRSAHTLERPFQCEVCEQSFGWKGELMRHLMTHTGEKPFECQFCLIKFTRNSSLQNHLKKFHGDEDIHKEILATSQT